MIPHKYLLPYLISNALALGLLVLAFRKPGWVRWTSVAIFLWAAWTNGRIALTRPLEYQTLGELAVVQAYRTFIHGWFRDHTPLLLLPIAVCQLVIAIFLVINTPHLRWAAVAGAIVFLLAIAPLGVGSAFPFSLTYSLALFIMARRMGATTGVVPSEASGA